MLTKIPVWPVAVQFRRSTAEFCHAVACLDLLISSLHVRFVLVSVPGHAYVKQFGADLSAQGMKDVGLHCLSCTLARPIPPSTAIR